MTPSTPSTSPAVSAVEPLRAGRAPVFLVADDDPHMRRFMTWALETNFPGASVVTLSGPARVVATAVAIRPQVVFLDWVFGRGRTGPQVCDELKKHPMTRRTPVAIMSGLRTDLDSRAKAVGTGAALHLSKPFTVEELTAFTRALLRRSVEAPESALRAGSLRLQRGSRGVWWGAKRLPPFPPVLFNLLWLLARHSPEPVSNGEAIRLVWRRPVRDDYVAVAVERLRRKLALAEGVRIEAVLAKGYRLITA